MKYSVPLVLIGNMLYIPDTPCTKGRELAGDTEGRTLGGDTEGRALGGDTEGRTLGGDTEGRTLGGDTEGRTLGGDTEGRTLGGDTEGRTLGGDTEGRTLGGAMYTLTCFALPDGTGFSISGLSSGEPIWIFMKGQKSKVTKNIVVY
jgi:hypothetical protein